MTLKGGCVVLILLGLLLCHSSAFDFTALATTCSACQLVKDLSFYDLPLDELKTLLKNHCVENAVGFQNLCASLSESVFSDFMIQAKQLNCSDFCGQNDKTLNKDLACGSLKMAHNNMNFIQVYLLSKSKSICSTQADSLTCTKNALSEFPFAITYLKNSLFHLAQAIDPAQGCSLHVSLTSKLEDSGPPMTCYMCKYFLNWIGQCFVTENKTSRQMQANIRKIVVKVCDLNKICPALFNCSCETIANDVINIIRKMDVSYKACIKHNSACAEA
ncbi:hypothetical protein L596_026033 [Steinernema carpocapsae]|uniref:Saposin B-type domain-containing protein n=1 Tax=Steinernema carpocapsae TaxID=34508 RepID=A0A4U5M148_STECR|nr:hypothetical protein L596_026033 [Steinernema carpocapsae]